MLTPAQLQQRTDDRFPDNDLLLVTPKTFRDQTADLLATFVPLAEANVPAYDPKRFYAEEYLVTFNGLYYRAKLQGFLPAPTPGLETVEWKPDLKPLPPLLPYREMPVQQGQAEAGHGLLEPSKLYRFTGRVDAQGVALDDVLVPAVSRYRVAAADAYTIGLGPLTGDELLLPVSYELATDTTSPRTGGGGTVDAYTRDEADALLATKGDELVQQQQGQDIAGLLAAAAARQRPFEVVQPSGEVVYARSWTDLQFLVQPGAQVRLRGAYGDAQTNCLMPGDITLHLAAGSVLTCQLLFVHGGPAGADGWKNRAIEGPGTLAGKLMSYGDSQVRLRLRDFQHQGSIEYTAYGGPVGGRLGFELLADNVTAVAPAGVPWLNLLHKNGGFYTAWYQASLYQCRLTTSVAPIRLASNNNDVSTDADGVANNRLRLVSNTLAGPAGVNVNVLDTSQAGTACTFEFGANWLKELAAPTVPVASTFTAFGAGGSGGGSGVVDAYTTAESDALLAKKATLDASGKLLLSQVPQQYKYTYSYDAGQTQAPEYKIVPYAAAGYYGIEISQNVAVSATFLNDIQVAPDGNGHFLFAQGDRFRIEGTAPAGQRGLILLAQVV